ncbi:hypothetical protein B1808_02685 [Pseudofulvimonas gallinarii]|uniref:hypothetical protein n=1 Tax=Pseudofulvimonas gallinarii TaxID=634155 RepID=UPI000F49E161|nr:hypothetical protein [Pseudofulvimonas gallinarii]THD14587.1 hypothetical protein B1808_02685 [Pseudofulvimonas gallinarii]
MERPALAVVWAGAGLGLAAWVAMSGWRLRALLVLQGVDWLALAALVGTLSVGALALSAALASQWRHVSTLAQIVTWPFTAFSAWALVWFGLAFMSTPGGPSLVPVSIAVAGLYVAHRTRRISGAISMRGRSRTEAETG